MKRFKSEDQKRREKDNRTLIYSMIGITVIFLLAYNIIFPMTLIGTIWDYDIKSQLEYQNKDGLEKNADEVRFRLTYENNDETDLRIQRAINVYNDLFDENTYEILKQENQTLLELTWKVNKLD